MGGRVMDQRVTYSQRTCAQSCLRKHCLAYVHGIRPAGQAKALRMGSATHLGLDLQAQGMEPSTAIAHALATYDWDMPTDEERRYLWTIERETVGCLLSGYFWRWTNQPMKVIATEQSVTAPIYNPVTQRPMRTHKNAGKIDKIWQLEDGRLAVGEHKTTSDDISPESDYWKRLRIDSQISDYLDMARANGWAVDTVIYDVIRKPTIRPKLVPILDDDGRKVVVDERGNRMHLANGKPRQAPEKDSKQRLLQRRETPTEFSHRLREDIGARPDFYYARREIARTEDDLIEARWDTYQTTKLIHECNLENRWPRSTRACLTYGRCPYFELCTSGWNPNSDETLPEGFVIVDDPHQELAEA